jgi:flagellar biosynthesis protein FliQ
MATAGIVYAALTLTYARSYLETEIPTALLGYWSYKSPMQEVLRSALALLTPAAMLLGLGYLTRQQGVRVPVLTQALAVAGAASLFAAIIQAKPWSYHFLPGIIFFCLSAVALLAAENPRADRLSIRRIGFAMLVFMAIAPTAFEVMRIFEGASSRESQLAAVFRDHPGPNKTVFGFITSPREVFPAVIAAGVEWAAPFCCEYLIAAAARVDEAPAPDRPKIKAAGLNQAEMAISAVRIKEPGVIVIATGNDMLGFNHRAFDYVAWLSANTDFASTLVRYRETSPIGPFRIFVRK